MPYAKHTKFEHLSRTVFSHVQLYASLQNVMKELVFEKRTLLVENALNLILLVKSKRNFSGMKLYETFMLMISTI